MSQEECSKQSSKAFFSGVDAQKLMGGEVKVKEKRPDEDRLQTVESRGDLSNHTPGKWHLTNAYRKGYESVSRGMIR